MIDQFVLDCEQHENSKVGEFGAYFRLNYASRPEEWALSLRGLEAYTTNMVCESLHKKLKQNPAYMDYKHNKRLDTLLDHLSTLVGEMIRRLIQCKKSISNKQTTANYQCHRRAASVYQEAAVQGINLVTETDVGWNVASFDKSDTFYQVTENDTKCPFEEGSFEGMTCFESCYMCGACWHLMRCTCEYSENLNCRSHSCKHVHIVFM